MSYKLTGCPKCGGPKAFHHINGNPYDNRTVNLRIVCLRGCK